MKKLQKVLSWVSDYRHMVRGAFGGLVYINPPKHYKEFVLEGRVPVILIPGVLGRWSFLKNLGDKISKEGHAVFVVKELKYNLFSVSKSAEIVHKAVEEIKKEMPEFHGAVIVAHSKGGLIGKYYLSHFNKDNAVSRIISIATPYSGSAMAALLPVEPIKELHHDSLLIHYLKGHKQVNHLITSLCPAYDNHVWSKEGSYLEGAHNIKVLVHGHHKIVYDKGVQELILSELKKC